MGLVFVRSTRWVARWLCRRCLPVCGPPTPALGRVAFAHTLLRL